MLTKTQKIQIVEILNNKKPTDFGFDYEFWTASILGFLIGEQYGVKYKSKTSIYLIFKQAKFTFHKPEKKSEKHDEKVINEWKKHYEGIIKEECNRQDTIVLAGDEAVLTSTTRLQRVWLPNEYPAFVQDTTKRETVHLYGFLNVQSGVAVAFKTEAQTGELTVAVLKKLARLYPNKRIVIFWDNASWHKCAVVRQFLTETKQFKLYNCPPYAPELNPQEHVWKEMRDNVLSNVFIKNMKVAVDKAIQYIDNTIFKYKFFGLHGTSNV